MASIITRRLFLKIMAATVTLLGSGLPAYKPHPPRKPTMTPTAINIATAMPTATGTAIPYSSSLPYRSPMTYQGA